MIFLGLHEFFFYKNEFAFFFSFHLLYKNWQPSKARKLRCLNFVIKIIFSILAVVSEKNKKKIRGLEILLSFNINNGDIPVG